MNRIFVPRLWLLAAGLLGLAVSLPAQNTALAKEAALRFLQSNPTEFNLNAQDVSDLRITDAYLSKHNGVTHVWVQQQHASIPVYNALFGLHVKPDGSVFHLGHRFVPELAQRVNTTLPSLSASRALEIAVLELGFDASQMPGLKRKIDERNWVFEAGAVSRAEIPVRICYQLDEKGQVRLAWNLYIDQANTSDLWTICVDAQTGRILSRLNHTVYCKAGHPHLLGESCSDEKPSSPDNSKLKTQNSKLKTAEGGVDESYRVFALPTESPAHGARQLVVNPADLIASPFGWLDLDGIAGAENTYSRGNNVWAFEDQANDNSPSQSESVDGGPTLTFDFPFDPNAEPLVNLNAAITNLFYMNNKMHDIFYRHGFDEPSGNFQTNNYGHGGAGNDAVLAQGLDGGGENNANFATPADGSPGRMQMFVWSGASGDIVRVNAPSVILGNYYAQPSSGWGGAITDIPVTGDVVVTDDGTGSDDATKNCKPPVNNLQGKIVMVDRGVCEFGRKALTAQQNGAIACIICNFEDATAGMAAGAVGAQVTIPTMMMAKSDCDILRQYAGAGLNISLVQPLVSGPDFLDGDFDNGIIAHEYGHGISNRLTGGPSQSGCLGNAEQMGEGWSDWFTLVTSVKPADVAAQRRGVGTYVLRQPNDGVGIRRFPYTTDMSVNPLTYATVAASNGEHAIGEVWATVTWDLYWAMVEKYGYDPDINNTNSGNYRAVQLVIDGMKFQPCSPGFIDGRDAIMIADILNYEGVDTCLISEVFARRGMGYFASQGLSDNSGDGIENFDPIPTCVKELKIRKETSTPEIQPGNEAKFTITVTNHKDVPAVNVVVSDPLPNGLTLVSASNGGAVNGGAISWNLGTLAPGTEIVLSYTAKSDAGMKSLLQFRDDMDIEGDNWLALVSEGALLFYLQSDSVKVGSMAWRADAPDVETDQSLFHIIPVPVSGTQPVMRFWHNYRTLAGSDAGFLEIQIIGESSWRRLAPEKSFRNGYPSAIEYQTFAIPYLSGFSGNSNGWVRSYFDLSDFKGKEILFQFRFGTSDITTTNVTNGGWIVDQVDLLDLLNYDTEACVSSDAGDMACSRAPQRGVLVDAGATISAGEAADNALGLQVQPNPASDVLSLIFGEAAEGPVQIRLIGTDGRVVAQHQTNGLAAGQVFPLNIANLPEGLYLVQVESSKGNSVAKVVVRR